MSDGSAQVGQGAPPPKSSSHVSGAPDPSSILPLSPKSSPVKSLDASTATTHSTSEPTLHPVLSENTIDNCEHHGGAASTEPPATGLPLGSSLSSSQSASSSSAIPLHAPVATKPRSNSQLHSTRPAPPSPAPSRPGSRPGSQILSPGLLTGTTGTFPSSPSSSRDRAGSTSSSRGASTLGMGRRVSNSSASGRAVSKSRPKSALGASSFLPQGDGASDSETQTGASTPTHLNSSSALSGIVGGSGSSNAESSLVSESIPEHGVPVIQSRSPNIAPSSPMISEDHRSSASGKASPSVESKPKRQEVIIRDFAFPKTDPRFEGPGLPLSAPTPTEEPSSSSSRRNSRWGNFSLGDGSDNGTGASSGGFGRKLSGSGWSGFGMLSWKGLMGRSSRRPSQSVDDHAIGDDDDDDYPINIAPDHDEDDYAFSDSETPSTTSQQGDSHQHLFQISGVDSEADEGEEPFGIYRAMYPFDAVGEHEIGLEEGDLLEVRGRGGGQGWVVAVRRTLDPEGKLVRLRKNSEGESEEKEGLVPESYLERVDSLSATEEGRPTSTASASPLTNPTTAGGTTSHSSSGVLDVIPESTSTNQLEPLSGGFKTSGQTTQAEPIAQKTDEPELMNSSEEAGFEKEAAT